MTRRRHTLGILVMPPTSSTSLMSVADTPASFMQSLQGCWVRFSRSPTKLSNLHRFRLLTQDCNENCNREGEVQGAWAPLRIFKHKLPHLHGKLLTALLPVTGVCRVGMCTRSLICCLPRLNLCAPSANSNLPQPSVPTHKLSKLHKQSLSLVQTHRNSNSHVQ